MCIEELIVLIEVDWWSGKMGCSQAFGNMDNYSRPRKLHIQRLHKARLRRVFGDSRQFDITSIPHTSVLLIELFLSSLPRTRKVSSGSCRLWIKPMATASGSKSSEAWRP